MTPPLVTRDFKIKVLGRTLEHLGVQMYKRRDIALAELVANAWDAGADRVDITIPTPDGYDQTTSEIVVMDNGSGMTGDEIQNAYLVIGRNRRSDGQRGPAGRPIMGRKGVGKLAGFGIGKEMLVETWRDGTTTAFMLNSTELKADDGDTAEHKIPGTVTTSLPESGSSGSKIVMSDLKHKTPPDIRALHESLSRRFSRAVKGAMSIHVNGTELQEPVLNFSQRWPAEDEADLRATLNDGNEVAWWAGFSDTVLQPQLQGFTLLVNGKTAQAPPFFFGVESSASGQHGTKYLTGVIEADFLDSGDGDEPDRISTDRQEIDWEDEDTSALRTWGANKTRELLLERVKSRENTTEDLIMKSPDIADRVGNLDSESQKRVRQFIRKLGWSETDHEKLHELADTIVRAFEYRHFHDYIDELERVVHDEPLHLTELVSHLSGWKVLESRAILEVVRGRIEILDTFHKMLVEDSPETAPKIGGDNLHDLVASFPWLINPEWQTFAEEKTISKQLRDWGDVDLDPSDRTRYDFLALSSDSEYVVIEIKRASHAATLEDLQQLERYVGKLGQARESVSGLFIAGGGYNMSEKMFASWNAGDLMEATEWSIVHERTRKYYDHYHAVLDGDIESDSFARKEREVSRTRNVLKRGSYRGPAGRAGGIDDQDVNYSGGSASR
ncbi:hypothetical protein CH262_25780 [Rhodococcus sp. 05-2255-1e]|uniref:ATP-binding protein n=1 Tax=Rhodococcus sp. 05-2255-1e TaxID=2022495 RepID=UPI000B9C601A|nr:ATP-binding protein [Rhodococcus sp. 05-2255-1e]OZE17670.1 hypothetical protein CH262_25780 [Rhodococcus sp. 05-2255-1e]